MSDTQRTDPPQIDQEPGDRDRFLEWMAREYEGEFKGRVAELLLQSSEDSN